MAALLVYYKPTFIRQLNKLDEDFQQEVVEVIELMKNRNNHPKLAVHKLHGILAGRYAASVNYKYRIVFQYLSKTEVVLLAIGDHEVYR